MQAFNVPTAIPKSPYPFVLKTSSSAVGAMHRASIKNSCAPLMAVTMVLQVSPCAPLMAVTMVLQILLLIGVLAVVVLRLEHVGSSQVDKVSRLDEYQHRRTATGQIFRRIGGIMRRGGHQQAQHGNDSEGIPGLNPVHGQGELGRLSTEGLDGQERTSGIGISHQASLGDDAAKSSETTDLRIYKEPISTWPYTCWTPKNGLASPLLTIATVIDGLPATYHTSLMKNRLQYAARHGYRYCELQMTDRNKIPAFSKLPWMLALSPCTDFLIHVDADAMFSNLDLTLDPWVNFMQSKGLDQLFSKDCISESPINFGVFMIRPAPWIWNFYRKVYNQCVCDWSRMNDWPAEQGIIYDLMAEQQDSYETGRSLIVSEKGWNHIIFDGSLPNPDDLLVHITFPRLFPKQDRKHNCSDSKYRKNAERECKYAGLMYFLDEVIGNKHYKKDLDLREVFTEEQNSCQQVRHNSLFVARTTFFNRIKDGAIPASVMDFDIDTRTGQVSAVKVSEVGCLGYRENKCSLQRYWNKEEGYGPWEPFNKEIV
ncbi:hypothetical protein CEUSTIGMA_g6189.t1 [Chlamydomonas eustigma]|uniref:Nucleotide-diphospho-sugar transferase domain-containing protein n=1 Tax=Chlamydomonas eustigma TaxID=1157962 RepID=A0A250X785_9CHLO|nr:hypothetical protein CEUSTIGMA_g6189.t1 [Chlamydomonas eustigma]|eukprot:GAX78752.1 hypothetical protein CEUSTIGMA_g6189.t1 [Chlamydomonas eustigma]